MKDGYWGRWSLCWVSKGMLRRRHGPGGAGMQRLRYTPLVVDTGSAAKELEQRHSGGGWWGRGINTCLFPCKAFHSFPLDSVEMGADELGSLSPVQLGSIEKGCRSRRAGKPEWDGQSEWQEGTRHLLLHWRGSETEGITAFCKVIREVRAKQRVKAELHDESSLKNNESGQNQLFF